MSSPTDGARKLSLEELAGLRAKSESISKFLYDQLAATIATLHPLLTPGSVFGKYAGGREEAPSATKALEKIQALYVSLVGKPFPLPRELDKDWLPGVSDQIVLQPWVYRHEARSGSAAKSIAITSPVRWVLGYKSPYSLQELTDASATHGPKHVDLIRQQVVSTLVTDVVLAYRPGIAPLLNGLRYALKREKIQGLGELPVWTISSNACAFRPADDLLITATGFSGVSAFFELIDFDALRNLPDPLKESIANLVGQD